MHAMSRLLVAAMLAMLGPLPASAGSIIVVQTGSTTHQFMAPHRFAMSFPSFRTNSTIGFIAPFGAYGAMPVDNPPLPPIVVNTPAPPQPLRSQVDERPTVEITASGVQIVRGPGTRHTVR
jgi:hypothetical protein